MATDASDGAKPRRPGRKSRPAPRDGGAEKVRLSLRLAPDVAERLGVHALKARRSQAELIEDLVRAHLRRYVVQDRGEGRGEGGGGEGQPG